MTAENFEKYTRDKLSGHRSQIDAEALWAGVHSELNPKQKRRFLGFWLCLGLAIGSAAFYFGVNQYFANNGNPNLRATVIPVISTEEKEPSIITVEQNRPNPNTATPATIAPTTITQKNTSSVTPINNTRAKTNITHSERLQKFANTPKNQTAPVSNSIPANAKNATVVSNVTKEAKSLVVATNQEEQVPVAVAAADNVINPKENISSDEIIQEETVLPVIEENNIVEEKIAEVEQKEVAMEAELLSRSFTKDISFGFGIRGGISSSLTTLNGSEEPGITLSRLRENSETSLETIELGIEALVKHELGFYATTGIDYLRYTRRFNFEEETVVVDSIPGVTRIFVNPITMDTTFDNGQIAQTTTTTQIKEIYNVHEFINIPLSVGYQFGYEAWSFGVEAGALFNIRTNYRGQIRDSESTFYDLKEDTNNWFKENVGVSFRASILLGYTINDVVQIYLGPSFRSPIRLDETENPVSQEQTGLGFQIGARYWLDL